MPENRIRIGAGVGHDLDRLQLGFLLQHDGEQHQAVAQRARHHYAVETGVLVRGHIVVGDAALATEISRVRPGMDGADRHHKPQPVGGRHLAGAPGANEVDAILRGDELRVCCRQRIGADVVLLDPAEARSAHGRHLWLDHRLKSGVEGL
jgi:hypothetical protein